MIKLENSKVSILGFILKLFIINNMSKKKGQSSSSLTSLMEMYSDAMAAKANAELKLLNFMKEAQSGNSKLSQKMEEEQRKLQEEQKKQQEKVDRQNKETQEALMKERDQINQQYNESQQQIRLLKKVIQDLKNELFEEKQKNENGLGLDQKQMEIELREMNLIQEKELKEKEDLIEKQNQAIQELLVDMQAIKLENAELNQQLNDKFTNFSSQQGMQSKLWEIEEEFERSTNLLKSMVSSDEIKFLQEDEKQKKIDELEQLIEKMKNDINTLSKENKELREQISKSDQEFQELKSKIQEMKSQAQEICAVLNNKQILKSIENREQQLESFGEKVKKLKTILTSKIKNNTESHQKQIEQLKLELNDSNNVIQDQLKTIEKLKIEISKLQQEHNSKAEENKSDQNQILYNKINEQNQHLSSQLIGAQLKSAQEKQIIESIEQFLQKYTPESSNKNIKERLKQIEIKIKTKPPGTGRIHNRNATNFFMRNSDMNSSNVAMNYSTRFSEQMRKVNTEGSNFANDDQVGNILDTFEDDQENGQ